MPASAIVVGASSGIGRALARLLAQDGYTLGLAARRIAVLEEVKREVDGRAVTKAIDVSRVEEARASLRELVAELGDVELVVLSAGVSIKSATWEEELQTIAVNVTGFVGLANVAMEHFTQRGSGHLVALSSIAGLRGARGEAAVYGASKAFVSNYAEALRMKAAALGIDIAVTEVTPGYVDTPMTAGQKGMFWVVPVEVAARQIQRAIRRRRRHVYVSRRWRLVAWAMKVLPFPVLAWLSRKRRVRIEPPAGG
jgi:short-subunit dehydrogenase